MTSLNNLNNSLKSYQTYQPKPNFPGWGEDQKLSRQDLEQIPAQNKQLGNGTSGQAVQDL